MPSSEIKQRRQQRRRRRSVVLVGSSRRLLLLLHASPASFTAGAGGSHCCLLPSTRSRSPPLAPVACAVAAFFFLVPRCCCAHCHYRRGKGKRQVENRVSLKITISKGSMDSLHDFGILWRLEYIYVYGYTKLLIIFCSEFVFHFCAIS